MTSPIRELSQTLIDQIKAGEVIERPGYLVKELLENAVDSKANEIFIHIIDNGMKLIHVKDNGSGMNAADLPLAFKRHSTSKIFNFNDLYKLHSFGFRGEALASIAAVSKLVCESKKADQPGARIEIHGGEHQLLSATDKKELGTEIFVKDLFFNTPVRLKFVSSAQAEKNFMKRVLMGFILAHPEVEFKLRIDSEDLKIFNKTENTLNRAKDCYALFDNFSSDFNLVNKSYDGINLSILMSKTKNFKNISAVKNYIFINHRLVQNAQIHNIVSNILMENSDQYPRYVLNLQIPPDHIDVNVHPNKTFVKFFETNKVIALVKGTIKNNQEDYDFSKKSNSHSAHLKNDFNEGYSINDNDLFFPILNSDYFFINKNNQTYIGSTIKSIKYLFYQSIVNDDVVSVPLLISEPIDGELSKDQCELFELMGFEMDILDEQTLALRSYPKALADYPYLKILKSLISIIRDEKDPKELAQNFLLSNTSWDSPAFNHLLSLETIDDSWQDLIQRNIISSVPVNLLGDFFGK